MVNLLHKPVDIFALCLPEIKELIKGKDFYELKSFIKNLHSMDIANGWRYLEPTEKIIIFRLLRTRKAVEVFENLRYSEQTHIFNNLENAEVAQIINEMAPDLRADLFKELPPKVMKKFFLLLSREKTNNIKDLMVYKEGTAGSLMTTEFMELKKDMTARQALLDIQNGLKADYRGNVYSVFVVEENLKLIGSISLQGLLKAPPDIQVKDIMERADAIKIYAEADVKDVTNKFKKYELLDAPVVDKENKLLGRITVDDILDVMEKEATEDIYHMAGIAATEEDPLLRRSVLAVTRLRLLWLVICLVGGLAATGVIEIFEKAIAAVVVLVAYIPVIMGMGGNIGTQSSTIIIRGLATGRINVKNSWKILWRELRIGLSIGAICGVAVGVVAHMWQGTPRLGIVVGVSMTATIVVAATVGAMLPILFQRFRVDPAVASGPAVTTVKDITGLLIYFGIATLIMGL